MDSKRAVGLGPDMSMMAKLIITDWRLDHSLGKVNLTVIEL